MKPNLEWRGMSFLFCPVLSILTVEWKFLTSPDVEEFTPSPSALLETCGEASLSLAPHHSGETNRNGGVSAQPPICQQAEKVSSPPPPFPQSAQQRAFLPCKGSPESSAFQFVAAEFIRENRKLEVRLRVKSHSLCH